MKVSRFLRSMSFLGALLPVAAICQPVAVSNMETPAKKGNLAVVATTSSSARFGQSLNFLSDGLTPTNQGNRGGGGGNRQPQPRTNLWVQYEWNQPISTKEVAVYWWNYNGNLRLPEAYRLQYWDGTNFVPIKKF